jgi:hypothetical protein
MKKSEWFPGSLLPVHVGVYETEPGLDGQPWFQHWNGKFWSIAKRSAWEAESVAGIHSMHQRDQWRGLLIIEK